MVEQERARRLAAELFAAHLPEGGWCFEFDRAKRRAGACDYSRRRITLSRALTESSDEADVRQVLLHEIAHAVAGHAAAHGPEWRRVAARLGYTGSRLREGPPAAEHATWIGVCPAGHEHYRFRRPGAPMSCGRCSRRWSTSHLIEWRHRPPGNGVAPGSDPARQSTTRTSFQNAT